MEASAASWYAAGCVGLILLLIFFVRSWRWLVRALCSTLLGGITLWVLNQVGQSVGVHLAVNPASAAIVGLLGVPGLISLGVVRLLLG